MGPIHHIELWTEDLRAAEPGWDWLLTRLGFALEPNPDWPKGRAWHHPSGSYLCLEQSSVVTGPHHRMDAGLNHLAFVVPPACSLSELRAEAPRHGWRELFTDSFPTAGGEDHHALYLENAQGFEVELLGHRANNPASGVVARAAGFVLEGTERAKFLVSGQRVDVLSYGRLATDPWPTAEELPLGLG